MPITRFQYYWNSTAATVAGITGCT
ncbi:unnamed protein product, partial [Rotaria sp. Silwood2]